MLPQKKGRRAVEQDSLSILGLYTYLQITHVNRYTCMYTTSAHIHKEEEKGEEEDKATAAVDPTGPIQEIVTHTYVTYVCKSTQRYVF